MELKFLFAALTAITVLFVLITTKYIEEHKDENHENYNQIQDKKFNNEQEINCKIN